MLKAMLVVLMAGGLLCFSATAWVYMHPATQAVAPVRKVSLLAAVGTLRAGTLLKPDDIEVREVEGDLPAGARRDTLQSRSELFGAMVRQTLLPHQVILPANVMRPGDHGFLAAVLTPGKRATSVGVDSVSGTAGLIWPGDHVDLILTQEIEDPAIPIGRRFAGETVLRDVRVIAIDQQLMQGGTASGIETVPQSRTVTLEVSSEDAEKIAVATRLGKIELAVRPVDAGGAGVVQDHAVTYSQDVSRAIGNVRRSADNERTSTLHVFSGVTDKEYHF